MPTVLIFKETLLPPSETFILAQMTALARFSPVLVGLEPVSRGLALSAEPILLSERATRVADLRSKLYRRVAFAPGFHRRVSGLGADLIHAHFASGGKTLLPLQKKSGRPMIVTLHGGSDVPTAKPRKGVYSKLADRASLFLCVSDFIRKQAIEAGYPQEKLLVHYIGIDRKLFSPPAQSRPSRSVLFVGRLVEMKGPEYLLRAMQTVQGISPDISLTVAGDGPLRSGLEQLAADLRIRCQFLGVQPPSAVRRLLQEARLLCLPSVTTAAGDREGLPTVLVEAQAMGVPVVSTFHSGIPEAVADGITGILVPERHAEQLAEAILRLMCDDSLWLQYHQATQAHIDRRFDLCRQTAVLEEIYAGQLSQA